MADAGGRIVAHYYDIESGTRRYDARGSGGLAGFDVPIPRDGGLHDLLAAVATRPLAFDRVTVESISRLSRNSSVAFRIEEELAMAGVRFCAADEPLEAPETNQSMLALIARRILELEDAIADRRARLEHLEGQLPPEPPRLEDVALVLARLPILGQRLAELPSAELRALFESLQLTVTYFPDTRDAVVEITLRAGATKGHDDAQVCSVPPGGAGPDLSRPMSLVGRMPV